MSRIKSRLSAYRDYLRPLVMEANVVRRCFSYDSTATG